jgi:TPR repeat protein
VQLAPDLGVSIPALADIAEDFGSYQVCISRGQGTKGWLQTRTARISRWEAAALQNDTRALVLLGDCYDQGVGVSQDYTEATKWYRNAADSGNGLAMRNIGLFYEFGKGVAANRQLAREWYQRAIAAGWVQAEKFLNRLES